MPLYPVTQRQPRRQLANSRAGLSAAGGAEMDAGDAGEVRRCVGVWECGRMGRVVKVGGWKDGWLGQILASS